MRTDEYGAVRASQGLLISSYAAQASEPAADNAPGMALAKQLRTLGQNLSQAAATHQTVALAAHIGSQKPPSKPSPQTAPALQALHTSLSGMVSPAGLSQAQEDAANANTATHQKLPHTSSANVAIAARGGLIQTAQAIHLGAGDTLTLAAGQTSDLASAAAQRIHTGQAIGVLGGAIKPGQGAGTGLSLLAAQGKVSLQAQAGPMQVAAKKDLKLQTANAHIDWAAAKKITLATSGGASIVIEGGNITVQCPGKITVKAGKKSFVGITLRPKACLPRQSMQLDEQFQFVDDAGDPLARCGEATV